MHKGVLDFPFVDFNVNLSDGSYHDVDSSEMAFKLAARIAMVDGMPQCSPVLLEPVLAVDIHVPNDATASVGTFETRFDHLAELSGRAAEHVVEGARAEAA